MLESGLLTDFQIHAETRVFKAHRAVLAIRCPYFYGMMKPHTEEFQTGVLHIGGISAEVSFFGKAFISWLKANMA